MVVILGCKDYTLYIKMEAVKMEKVKQGLLLNNLCSK